jgi:hypothetical protein
MKPFSQDGEEASATIAPLIALVLISSKGLLHLEVQVPLWPLLGSLPPSLGLPAGGRLTARKHAMHGHRTVLQEPADFYLLGSSVVFPCFLFFKGK